MKIKRLPVVPAPEGTKLLLPGTIEWLREHGITQSVLKTWRSSCPTKARWLLNGYKQDEFGYPIYFGNVFHAYMEEILCGIRDNTINAYTDIEFERVGFEIRVKMDREFGYEPGARTHRDYEKAHAIAPILAKKYFQVWGSDFFGDTKQSYVQIEDKFKVFPESLGGVPWTGRRDLVTRKKSGLYLEEFKTKANWSTGDLSMLIFRELQVITYMKTYEIEFGEMPVGVIYNVVKRPGLKQKDLETLAQYARRVELEVDADPDSYFAKIPMTIPKAYIDSQWEKALLDAKEFIEWYARDAKYDSQYTENCVNNYGACPYLKMCTVGSDERITKRDVIYAELAAD